MLDSIHAPIVDLTKPSIQVVKPRTNPTTKMATTPEPSRWDARKSYYGSTGYTMSEGLKRARRPFLVRNTLTGLLLLGFCGGVYTYSIAAVKQDDFSDVVGPSEEERPNLRSIEDEKREKVGSKVGAALSSLAGSGSGTTTTTTDQTSPQTGLVSGSVQGQFTTSPSPSSHPMPAFSPISSPSSSVPPKSSDGSQVPLSWLFKGRDHERGLIVGAPDVDRPGRAGDRTTRSST
jgi:hypothetical protein